jgi:hypothetical protein
VGFGATSSTPFDVDDDTIRGHLDYLVLCGKVTNLQQLTGAVWAAFGARFDFANAKPGTRGKYYELNAATVCGLTLSLNHIKSIQKIEYRLSIPGKPLQHIDGEKLHDFGRYMYAINAKCTRFDWAIDDFSRELDIDTIYAQCIDGNRHGFDSFSYYASGSRRQKRLGKTIYLGATDTDMLARIYDKNVESGGEINSIRWETQTRDAIANSFFAQYFCGRFCGENIRKISARAIGKYRFVQPVSQVLSRCPNLDWWESFVRRVGGQIKHSVKRLQPILADKISWVEKQVSDTISIICRCKGLDNTLKWLQELIEQKETENKEKHDIFYETWKDRKYVFQGRFSYNLESYDWFYPCSG